MNVRLQGVYMYGGGPQNHYVFRGEAQRRRRTRNITIILALVLACLVAWCAHLLYSEIAAPVAATADTALVQTADEATTPAAEQATEVN